MVAIYRNMCEAFAYKSFDDKEGIEMRMLNRTVLACSVLCWASHAIGAAAVVSAPTSNGLKYYFVGNQATIAKARAMALRDCHSDSSDHGKCVVQEADEGPLYWVVFHASNGSVGLGRSTDRQSAVDTAYAECRKLGACASEAAHVWYDEGQHQKVAAAPTPAGNCQPPTGKPLRSETYCENGDCVRRFENGCTIRFQAAYCYDPLEQRFMWKPDGC